MKDFTQLLLAIGFLLNAGATAFSAIQSFRNGRSARSIVAGQAEIRQDVASIKIETNHMKDALVASTAKASRAEGAAEGLAQGRSERASGKND